MESSVRRNRVFSGLSGALFFVGWWLMVDLCAGYPEVMGRAKIYQLPGLASALAFVAVNMVPESVVQAAKDGLGYVPEVEGRCCRACSPGNPRVGLIVLFVGLCTAFGALIGAAFILINDFLLDQNVAQYPGYGIFMQSATIFAANMIVKFAIHHDN